jgi:hypothetical protein
MMEHILFGESDRGIDVTEEELELGEPLRRAILRSWEAFRDLWRGVHRPEPRLVSSVKRQLSHQIADKNSTDVVVEILDQRSESLARESR